ncbi:hypothetical protein SAMN00808754_2472 [Thermanaeromonas toyohensis ToBE]|uniref:Uncharacterized protein n=1 Tax=Thermanaeromonas toyohensis ToBE TaxID=698762 RepID=A0A1W1VZ69_9FIRM|nr:hypothetical protein SAMN00808754_2472 [Thermanaeromonas toyohensis ToBE]
MEDLRVLLFLHIINAFLLSMTGLRLFGYRSSLRTLITLSITYGVAVWIVRGIYGHYHIPLGTHTIILTLIFSLLIRTIGKVNWGIALGAALVSSSLGMLGGGISILIIQFFQLSVTDVLSNPWLHVLIGHTENVFLVIMLIVNSRFGFTLTKPLEKQVSRDN